MALSLKPQHLSRYKDIARLFMKYGRGDLLHGAAAIAGGMLAGNILVNDLRSRKSRQRAVTRGGPPDA